MFIKFLPNSLSCCGRVLEISLPHSMEVVSKNIFVLFPKARMSFGSISFGEMELIKKVFPFGKNQAEYCFPNEEYDIPEASFFRIYYTRKRNF